MLGSTVGTTGTAEDSFSELSGSALGIVLGPMVGI